MWATIGVIGIVVYFVWMFSLMRMAAPATAEERRLDDEAQIHYLKTGKAK